NSWMRIACMDMKNLLVFEKGNTCATECHPVKPEEKRDRLCNLYRRFLTAGNKIYYHACGKRFPWLSGSCVPCSEGGQMASIMDLARRAQVSPTTVSRVLNNSSHPVSEAVRQRVLQAARELDYRPNALARAMITRRTRIVGVIVGDSSDPYFSTIVRGIETEARAHGYLVIICNTDRDPLVEQTYLRLLHDYQVDGIIFAGGSRHDCDSLSTVLNELR